MEYQQLQDEIKAAMKARDNHRRDILRQVHTELKAIEVNERREVTEADVDAKDEELSRQYELSVDLLRQQLPPLRLRHDLKLAAAQAVVVDSAKRK